MTRYLVATPVVIFMVLLAVGALTGRVRARTCCSPADPAADLRMRPLEPDGNLRDQDDSPSEISDESHCGRAD